MHSNIFLLPWKTCIIYFYSLQDMKIVLLTVGEGNKTSLMVQSLPTCEIVYNLQLHQPSTLANCQTFQVNTSVDTSAGGLLATKSFTRSVVSVSALKWFIRYICYWNLQFLNHIIINKTWVLLP